MKKSILLLMLITLSCSLLKATDFSELTPVDDPYTYQNPFYPLSVGNYWKMAHYKLLKEDEIFLTGYYYINVLEYTLQDIMFDDELEYVPVFKIEKKFIPLDSNIAITTTYQYAIKTEEGIVISNSEPHDNTLDAYLFVPSSGSKDKLSKSLTDKSIYREVEVKTPFFNMICMKIEVIEENDGGSVLFVEGKGHVLSLMYDDYPENTTRIDNQIVVLEYKLQ